MSNYYSYIVPTDFPTVSGAIADVIASGMWDGCVADIFVLSGSYPGVSSFSISGGIINVIAEEKSYIEEIYFLSSGTISFSNFNIDVFGTSGYGINNLVSCSGGNIISSGSASLNFISSTIGSSVNVVNTHTFVNQDVSGFLDSNIYLNNIEDVKLQSGNYNGSAFVFNLCSGIFIDGIYAANISGTVFAFSGCPDFTINHVTLSSDVSGYAIATFKESDSVNCSGNIDYSIIIGNAGSGQGPFIIDADQYVNTNLSCLYNFVANESLTDISGVYFNRDPLLVNPTSGDLRPDVNSPCASTADKIEFLNPLGDVEIIKTPANYESVKFYDYYMNIKATQPSGIYIVGSGDAIFFKADTSLINDMRVIINKQYTINNSGIVFQSFSNEGSSPGFSEDYKFIPKLDVTNNQTNYWVQPFSILDFTDILNSIDGTLQDVYVSGVYKYIGFTRDVFQNVDGTPLYWVGEYYNNFLYGYSSLTNERISTYPLLNTSGVYHADLSKSNLNYVSRTKTSNTIRTSKVYIDDHYEERLIQVPTSDGMFQLQTFEPEPRTKISSLAVLNDDLLVLTRRDTTSDNGSLDIDYNLYFYNKYKKDLYQQPDRIHSMLDLKDVVTGDMAFNDDGRLLISVSGYINTYRLYYDYALALRNPGIVKTTLIFREDYEDGVNV